MNLKSKNLYFSFRLYFLYRSGKTNFLMAIVLLFNYFSVPARRLIITLNSIDFTRSYYGSLSQILIRGERWLLKSYPDLSFSYA